MIRVLRSQLGVTRLHSIDAIRRIHSDIRGSEPSEHSLPTPTTSSVESIYSLHTFPRENLHRVLMVVRSHLAGIRFTSIQNNTAQQVSLRSSGMRSKGHIPKFPLLHGLSGLSAGVAPVQDIVEAPKPNCSRCPPQFSHPQPHNT